MKEIIIVGSIVLVFDILLIIIGKLLKKDPIVLAYLDLLPGYNCNACGFGSCQGMAEAMKKDKMSYLKCRPLKGAAKEKLEKSINV